MTAARPLVLHLVPRDQARGAQVYARQLRDALDGPDAAHQIVTFFDAARPVMEPDHSLGIRASRTRALGYDPRVPIRLYGLLRRLRPAVVVSHGGEALLYVAPVLPRRTRLAHFRIGTAGDLLRGATRRGVHRLAIARADVVGGVSLEVLDETRELLGVPDDRLRLLPNGRDPERYRPGDRSGLDGRAPVRLTFVGQLTPTKRPERFVLVVERLRAEGFEVEATMAGDGPSRSVIEARARRAGIEVLGTVDDIPSLLANSDIFVFTSEPTGEGMPGVCIEAGLCGLPVVATDVPGARTVIADGETGLVVGADDLAGLVSATRQLVSDPELRRSMGVAARERCGREFSLDVGFERWREALAPLLS